MKKFPPAIQVSSDPGYNENPILEKRRNSWVPKKPKQ
jgi:hypothetical protein